MKKGKPYKSPEIVHEEMTWGKNVLTESNVVQPITDGGSFNGGNYN